MPTNEINNNTMETLSNCTGFTVEFNMANTHEQSNAPSVGRLLKHTWH